jgi:RNA polymerase sigma-70 factor, ECF subfamily
MIFSGTSTKKFDIDDSTRLNDIKMIYANIGNYCLAIRILIRQQEKGMLMDEKDLESLITRLPKGDLEALEALYREFHHAVYSYSLLILHSQDLAEDNTQDVFMRIWDKSSTYRPGGNPKAWMMSITHNLAYDRFHRNAREVSLDELSNAASAADNRSQLHSIERLDLQTALKALTFDDRQIVLLKAIAGLPAKNVGQLLGLPPSTVQWRYHRALKLLAESLEVRYV